jgi:predicted nucleotidyltransferase
MKKKIVSMFKNRVLKILKSPRVKFILYGSRGRGDAEEFSDYDLLIITSEPESHVKEEIEEIETDIFIKHNAIINSHIFSEEELKQLAFEPFIKNALAEGVAA